MILPTKKKKKLTSFNYFSTFCIKWLKLKVAFFQLLISTINYYCIRCNTLVIAPILNPSLLSSFEHIFFNQLIQFSHFISLQEKRYSRKQMKSIYFTMKILVFHEF